MVGVQQSFHNPVGQPPPPLGEPPRFSARRARGSAQEHDPHGNVPTVPTAAPINLFSGSPHGAISPAATRKEQVHPSFHQERPVSASLGRPPSGRSRSREGPRPAATATPSQQGLHMSGDLDDYDEDLEPATEEEILSMAVHLGMDPQQDRHLLWVAAEAYDAPLPENWSEHFDWDGKVYFYNRVQDMVVRDHPLDDFYRELYKIVKTKGHMISDGEARAHAAAQAAALAQAAAFGQRSKHKAASPAPATAPRSRPQSAARRDAAIGPTPTKTAVKGPTTPQQTNSGEARPPGSSQQTQSPADSSERQFVASTMTFMENILETISKSQMENTQLQAQMHSQLIKQMQTSEKQEHTLAAMQREVLMKLESKLNSLQVVQQKELAHIQSLEQVHSKELEKLHQKAAEAADKVAEIAANQENGTGSKEMVEELMKQRQEAESHRQDIEARIGELKMQQGAEIEAVKLRAQNELAGVKGDLQTMITTLEGPEGVVDKDVLDAMAAAAGQHPEQPEGRDGPQVASSTASAIMLLREKLEHTERAAEEANSKMLQEKLARMNIDMEEALQQRIRALEAEHEVAISKLQSDLSRAEREVEAAREEIKWEKENSEKMMQTAMQMAATAGTKASEEEHSKVVKLQEALTQKEQQVLEVNAALENERNKLKVQEATNTRIEKMLSEMKSGASSLDSRLRQFEELMKTKEKEKEALMKEVSGLRAEAAAVKSSANDSAKAAQQAAMSQVSELNAKLEAERTRFAMMQQKKEHEYQRSLQEARSGGKITKKARKVMEQMQEEVQSLRRAYKSVKETQKSFMLYAYNKMAEAATALDSMTAHVAREKMVRDRLDLAVRECDRRMEPLVKERRRLFNELLTAKGNIRVFCRVRPFSEREKADGIKEAFTFPDHGSETLGYGGRLITTVGLAPAVPSKQYEFDKVFPPSAGQQETYEAVQPLIQSVMDGYNVCVFAYGQTGSGKTFTMEGVPENRGITYRAFDELFRMAREVWGAYEYTFRVHLLEVYNENIKDLLVKKGSDRERHDIKTDEEGLVYVTNIAYEMVTTPDDFVSLMRRGSNNRSTGATNMNDSSSRSHLIMGINVTCRNLVTGAVKKSKLSLVDLAGSERVGKTGAEGDRLKESMHINKSLSALGDVISSLTAKRSHIPFRNSKLTQILSDSLGNDSKTLLFVNCSPAQYNAHESSCSLNFAQRARNVDLSASGAGSSAVKRLKDSVAAARSESSAQITRLTEELTHYKGMVVKLQEESNKSTGSKKGKSGGAKASDADTVELRKELKEAKRQLAAAQGATDRLAKDNERKDTLIKSLEGSLAASGGLGAGRQMPAPEQAKLIQALEEKLSRKDSELAELRAQQSMGVTGRVGSFGSSGSSSFGSGSRPPSAGRHVPPLDAGTAPPLPGSDADVAKLRSQVSSLNDINRELLERCKAAKVEKVGLERQLSERDAAFKMLEAKYRLLVKKFAPAAAIASPSQLPVL